MTNIRTHSVGGVGVLDSATLVFLALKICGYFDGPWLLVVAPTLFRLALLGVFFALGCFGRVRTRRRFSLV